MLRRRVSNKRDHALDGAGRIRSMCAVVDEVDEPGLEIVDWRGKVSRGRISAGILIGYSVLVFKIHRIIYPHLNS